MKAERPRRVVWTSVAAGDLERLALYPVAEAPLRATPSSIASLSGPNPCRSFPSGGRIPPELRAVVDRSWREIQEPPWRTVYRILEDVVQVHAILDGRRSLEDILMERLLRT